MGAVGLYYYYQIFAKALGTVGDDIITDEEGRNHDWKKDLVDELARKQHANGAWSNIKSVKWFESDPNLATSFALLALHHSRPDKKDGKK